jgi:hypothetical protein
MFDPSKKTIVYKLNNPGIPNHIYWRERLSAWFNFEEYDELKTYNKADHILWVCRLEQDKSWITPFVDNGFKVVHEFLWDYYGESTVENGILILKSNHWTLADFSLRTQRKQYLVNSNPDKLFLCKIRKIDPNRDVLFDKIKHYADRALISYVKRGIELPDDITQEDPSFRWHQNPNWFNRTYFSLVVETSVTDPQFISEKIFTPFAFDHPIICYGPPRIMNLMEVLGFKTYAHIIDEYYDSIDDVPTKLQLIEQELERLDKEFSKGTKLFTDPLSLEIKAHNRNLIYSDELTTKIIWNEMVWPILGYSNG